MRDVETRYFQNTPAKTAAVLAVAATALLAMPLAATPADYGLSFTPRNFESRATPPLPGPETFPTRLFLDDDEPESIFGFTGGTARQFLWFNQFPDPGPFTLREIWVLFPNVPNISVGEPVQIVVYQDPDGDPTNGANLIASWDEVVQAADDSTFSIYPVSPGLEILSGGDVLIGVINRYFLTGVDPPPSQPAALDETDSQDRSWFALWSGDPPSIPVLPPDVVIDVLDGGTAGNWMIRGFGTRAATVSIPTLGPAGLACLALAMLLAGSLMIARRQAQASGQQGR